MAYYGEISKIRMPRLPEGAPPENVSTDNQVTRRGVLGAITGQVSLGIKEGEQAPIVQQQEAGEESLLEREMPRRQFLKGLLYGAAGIALGGAIGRAAILAGSDPSIKRLAEILKTEEGRDNLLKLKEKRVHEIVNREGIEEQISELVQDFQERYRILVTFEHNPHLSEGTTTKEARPLDRLRVMEVLRDEFATYPDWFIHKLHIPSVSIRNDIEKQLENGNKQRAAALCMKTHNALVIDPRGYRFPYSLTASDQDVVSELGRTVNHELMHAIDPWLHADVQDGTIPLPAHEADAWVKTHGENIPVYDPTTASYLHQVGDRPDGFAYAYGASSIFEDRATIFETLVGHTGNTDAIVKKKQELLMETLFKESKGLFTPTYFKLRGFATEFLGYAEPGDIFQEYFDEVRGHMLTMSREEMTQHYGAFASIDDETYNEWREFHRTTRYIPEVEDDMLEHNHGK
jgi:hypothetical protein